MQVAAGPRPGTWGVKNFASGRRHGTRICIEEKLRTSEVPMLSGKPAVYRGARRAKCSRWFLVAAASSGAAHIPLTIHGQYAAPSGRSAWIRGGRRGWDAGRPIRPPLRRIHAIALSPASCPLAGTSGVQQLTIARGKSSRDGSSSPTAARTRSMRTVVAAHEPSSGRQGTARLHALELHLRRWSRRHLDRRAGA